MDFAFIGHGAIVRAVRARLNAPGDPACVGIVEQASLLDGVRQAAPGIAVADSIAGLAALPKFVVEAAGHAALKAHGVEVLKRGSDLLVVSVGALADPALREALAAAAGQGGAKMLLVSGAIGGIDALAAARQGGLDSVRYTGRKPPKAWKGTPAEKVLDLDKVTAATPIFEGRPDDASRLYPQNANVATTIALAGIGFERTAVRLLADPAADGNIHEIEAEGAFGRMKLEFRGKPLPDNPKTSSLTAFCVLRALRNRASAMEI